MTAKDFVQDLVLLNRMRNVTHFTVCVGVCCFKQMVCVCFDFIVILGL